VKKKNIKYRIVS